MSDLYYLTIDLDRLAERFSRESGRQWSTRDTSKCLTELGFERTDEGWLAEAQLITLLDETEVLTRAPVDELKDAQPVQYSLRPNDLPDFRPYVLTAAKRERLSTMSDYELCTIPAFLCGSPAAVASKWRACAKRIIRHGHIAPAMTKVAFVHLDDAPGLIMVHKPIGLGRTAGNVLIYRIMEMLGELVADAAKNQHEIYIIDRQLLLDGLDHFWFCMCVMATGSFGPSDWEEYKADFEQVRREAVAKVLRWWPLLCAREDRFTAESALVTTWKMQWSGLCHFFDPRGPRQELQKMNASKSANTCGGGCRGDDFRALLGIQLDVIQDGQLSGQFGQIVSQEAIPL